MRRQAREWKNDDAIIYVTDALGIDDNKNK